MGFRIEVVDKLVEKISKELNSFAKQMDKEDKFNEWLFARKAVKRRVVEKYVRNEKTGNMEKVIKYKVAFMPTCNGHDQVKYLIDMAKLSESAEIAQLVNNALEMIINKTVNDEAYYIESNDATPTVVPFEYDFKEICEKYLSLPLNLQSKEGLLAFFENEELIENIGSLGYNVANLLMTEFKEDLASKDIKKLSEYIESRLWKMEDKIKAIDDKVLDKEAREAIARIINGKSQGKAYTQDLIKRLKKCDSKVRHYVKAKYNRELSHYFELLEPYGEGYKGNENELVNLYEDLKKTYDILNDQQYVEASRRHDEQISILKDYLANPKAVKKQADTQVKEEAKETKKSTRGKTSKLFDDIATAKALKPLIWNDEDIMD